jgi:hypothetical protein
MRTTRSNAWLVSLLVSACLLAGLVVRTYAATPAGITLTPATTTLNLARGQNSQQSSFTISNGYASPVSLHFAFAQSVTTPGAVFSAVKQLSIMPSDLVINGGTSVASTITLSDNSALAPGSQQVELVITQTAIPGSNVSVVSSIRMPLVIIKESGAVVSLSAGGLNKPDIAIKLPNTLALNIRNTGNVITIPHGYITVYDPRGREVSKGVINTASAAIAPGSQLHLSGSITPLRHAWLPGIYRVLVSYGIGGGRPDTAMTAHFIYIPLWELLLLLAIAALAYCGRRIWAEWIIVQALKHNPPTVPKQSLTMGKDIT